MTEPTVPSNVTAADTEPAQGLLAPLGTPLFRRIWLASVLSNLGFLFLSVASAWQMTALTTKADMVALVQTAMMVPMTCLSIPAGAIADMYDRRKIGLFSLSLAMASAALLAWLTFLGHATPWVLLGFCSLVGTGMTLFGPAWQASVGEQVPRAMLGQAVALNAISFNIARSFGPALGGLIVAIAGTAATFASTSVSYVPLFIVMLLWRRIPVPSRLPPERIDRAVSAGIRYVRHSPRIRIVLSRTFVFGFGGGALSTLMPLVARDLLHGTAEIYGLLLGAFGVGAIAGAIGLNRLRRTLSPEAVISLSTLVMAGASAATACSRSAILTGLVLLIAGAAWMVALTLCNVLVQTSAPRWVSGRLLAAYQTAIGGGVGAGSWCWGRTAQSSSVDVALLASAAFMAASLVLAVLMRMPSIDEVDLEPVKRSDPEVNLDLTGRSGPIVVVLEYRIPADKARDFYRAMMEVRLIRRRIGAFDWSLARDVADAELWMERFQFPTWHDYLRHRDRSTPHELEAYETAGQYMKDGYEVRVRRLLERPFGSVRWTEETPEVPPTTGG
jgi:MFS family permease